MKEYIKPNKYIEITKWHVWFAWHPVTVQVMDDGHYNRLWLCKVLRCAKRVGGWGEAWWEYEYKKIK